MTEFEYIIGIHTIVLGLATANLLTTVADTIKHRKTVGLYWVHTLWCVILQLNIVGWWYALWRDLSHVTEFSYASFISVFSVSVAIYLVTSLLRINISDDRTVDLEAYFYQIRVPAFLSLAFAHGVLLIRVALIGDAGTTGSSILDVINYTVTLGAPLAGMLFTSRVAQKAIVLVYSVTFLVVEVNQMGVGG